MFDFEYFIRRKDVVKRWIDTNLAKGLLEDAKDRFPFGEKILDEKPKYAFENAYEAVRELADALLALEGWKSFSHEASISFLQKFSDLSKTELEILDGIRKKRNDSKYYGKTVDKNQAVEDIKFLKKIFEKLIKILSAKLK